MNTPIAAEGVVRLVPRTPDARAQVAAIVRIARAAAGGDIVAVEQLDVLDVLLHHATSDATADREDVAGHRPGSAPVASIARRAA